MPILESTLDQIRAIHSDSVQIILGGNSGIGNEIINIGERIGLNQFCTIREHGEAISNSLYLKDICKLKDFNLFRSAKEIANIYYMITSKILPDSIILNSQKELLYNLLYEEPLRICKLIDQQIKESELRVERNPTDPQLRFDLGNHLFTAERFRDAIPHLQKAKNNPHIRIRSMLMLGRCYDEMKMYDLAIGSLSDANGEVLAMDNTKKEILYNLGLVYDKLGDKEHSLESFKEIYNADYDYRDVAKRVEESYS